MQHQLIQTFNAGINAGQHEGDGKSLEIRCFGFNLDHGGINGGLKILVDEIQQNQATQGHGRGYLGALKSLSLELVEDVSIINGPFSAAYGDFSGLGVVQIRQKESLPQVFAAFFPGQFSNGASPIRIRLDSAPHTVANGSFIVNEFYGINSSLNWRHISNYNLDGEDSSIRASGHDVVDFSIAKRLKKWADLNFSIDNLLDKRYFETQNYFESRICPTCDVVSRIHATPGYSRAFNIGLIFRMGTKN